MPRTLQSPCIFSATHSSLLHYTSLIYNSSLLHYKFLLHYTFSYTVPIYGTILLCLLHSTSLLYCSGYSSTTLIQFLLPLCCTIHPTPTLPLWCTIHPIPTLPLCCTIHPIPTLPLCCTIHPTPTLPLCYTIHPIPTLPLCCTIHPISLLHHSFMRYSFSVQRPKTIFSLFQIISSTSISPTHW